MKTNRSLWSVLSVGGCLAVAVSGGAGLVGGCAAAGGADEELGEAQLAIADVPSDVHCFRVTAQGVSRTVTRSIDVMPGQTIQATLSGLPTGQVTFTGEGFGTSCSAVGASSVAAWISDPVSATVATSPPVSVSLTLRRNGRATIGADFQGDGTCSPAGNMCMTDAQCCLGLICASGVCAAPAMCMPPVPVAGDCRTVICDAAGNVVVTVDDTDVPGDDGNQCTSELCLGGMPAHVPVPAGQPCNQGGGSICNATGVCASCLVPAQCPGTDSECRTRTCTNGACGALNTPAGVPVMSGQIAGDCRRSICDGRGSVASVADDTDIPVDANTCTLDVCSNGMPVHVLSPAGTSCGPGLLCNGVGQCVGCLTAADCPGTDTECAVRFCASGSCGFSFAPAGVPTASQVPADCRRNQCDGSGHIVVAPDATDLPFDGNQCTNDVCLGGAPANPPAPPGTPCTQSGGSACNGNGLCL